MAPDQSDAPHAASGRHISTPCPTRRWSSPPTSGYLRIRRAQHHFRPIKGDVALHLLGLPPVSLAPVPAAAVVHPVTRYPDGVGNVSMRCSGWSTSRGLLCRHADAVAPSALSTVERCISALDQDFLD